ncbi:GTP-binding protein [Lachnospiraceae bacterium YH-ros2228]
MFCGDSILPEDLLWVFLYSVVQFDFTIYLQEQKAIFAIKKWSADSAKAGHEDAQINELWFCVDGTSGKLFKNELESFKHATSLWQSLPIIIVITKSYSKADQDANKKMVSEALQTDPKLRSRVKGIIPVVAKPYPIDDEIIVPQSGVLELIELSNSLLPEGFKSAQKDVAAFNMARKRGMAEGFTGACTAAGVGIAWAPIPFADTPVLSGLETGEIQGIAKIYEINQGENAKEFIASLVSAGTIGIAAKTIISGLKAIPGVNIAASILNAIVAGSIISALGAACIYIFEEVARGNKSFSDIEWAQKIISDNINNQALKKVNNIIDSIKNKDVNKKDIADLINNLNKSIS